MSDRNELFVRMVMDAWTKELDATSKLLDKLSDEQLMREVAPSRNRGIYLLGHLTAVHDRMLPLLRFQTALNSELAPLFIDAPDSAVAVMPSVSQLREHWKLVNATLTDNMKRLPAEEWFTRHASVSAEDFQKEPHRNRLNLVINRTSHLAYHRGQLVLLANKD